jgi:hypothetical protein
LDELVPVTAVILQRSAEHCSRGGREGHRLTLVSLCEIGKIADLMGQVFSL